MAFNPLDQRGVPVEKKARNWSELNVTPSTSTRSIRTTRIREPLMTVEPTASAPPRPTWTHSGREACPRRRRRYLIAQLEVTT